MADDARWVDREVAHSTWGLEAVTTPMDVVLGLDGFLFASFFFMKKMGYVVVICVEACD